MPASWTEQQITGNLLRAGLYWTTPTVTYGFPSVAPGWAAGGEGPGFSEFAESQKVAARLAMSLWDDLAAVDFVEQAGATQVTFQNTTTDIGYAHAYYPGGWGGAGSVWLNPTYNSTYGTNDLVTPIVGKWGFNTYLHEIGHALGLEHPNDYPSGATYAANALYYQDTIQYTVMSYFAAANTGADWIASNNQSYTPQTPMLHDILAIQELYGVETTTRTGNTIYGFGSNADRSVYNFSTNLHPVLTIWDAAGSDTLNLSGFSTASRIDLNSGAYSDCDGMTKNIAIAFNCFIEKAVGGSASDSITGNALANVLQGNDGNDVLLGGDGNDTLDGGAGSDSLQGGNGVDTADYRYGAAVDINLATSTFAGAAAGDTYLSIERYYGSNSGNDGFTGGNASEYFYGFKGNDTFNGSLGKDYLFGGAGNDVFVYAALSHAGNGSGRDRIGDFAINLDDIDLAGIDAITGGGDDAFTFIGAIAFESVAGQLRTVQSATFTCVEGDIDGNGVADFQIELTGLLTLSAGDFIL